MALKNIGLLIIVFCVFACKENKASKSNGSQVDSTRVKEQSTEKEETQSMNVKRPKMTLEQAEKLADLPLECIDQKFPNKPGHIITGETDMQTPREMHPAFYGCFDWHSSVHGHWALVSLLKDFPQMKKADSIKSVLKRHLSQKNIEKEVAYFEDETHKTFERTYGWAWLLKLSEELKTWKAPVADTLYKNLKPLSDKIAANFKAFIPKLNYPLREGKHENTAFGFAMAYDYAETVKDSKLRNMIRTKAKDFYLGDDDCPIAYEPGGSDFLSPCLEEVDLMQRVLSKETFMMWIDDFLPQLKNKEFSLKPGEVSYRDDGYLVHLDGLNFSRAWVFYDLAEQYPSLSHLKALGDQHFEHSYSNLFNDTYHGGHWLGTFAIYALKSR